MYVKILENFFKFYDGGPWILLLKARSKIADWLLRGFIDVITSTFQYYDQSRPLYISSGAVVMTMTCMEIT